MLVASSDLIDMIHEHPFIADGGPQVQFNVVFREQNPTAYGSSSTQGVVIPRTSTSPLKNWGSSNQYH
jgi:hypothetical protein